MLPSWQRRVQGWLPPLHRHQVKALALASWAMGLAGSCQLSRLAAATPGAARVPSSERRWQRLIANDRLDVAALSSALSLPWLSRPGMMNLMLDETCNGRISVMKVSVQVRGRAAPLRWRCYPKGSPPQPMPQLVGGLLGSVDADLSRGASVTLLADRGLSWPVILDFCVAHGWHYLLRLQGQTRARLGDGRELSACELVGRPGASWVGEAEVFKDAGWRRVNLCARWPPGGDEPWLLITDLPATGQRFIQYRKRMRQELSFRDEKSHGLRWRESRVECPGHADRLLVVMALATMWLLMAGLALLRRGRRRELERGARRTLSVFQLGVRWWLRELANLAATGPPTRLRKCVGR